MVWQHRWLQLKWGPGTERLGIAARETIPVVLAAVYWGRSWTSKHVLFRVDNSTVVFALQSRSCRDQQVMRLIRLLHFVAADFPFTFTAEHIPGTEIIVADAISLNLMAAMFDVCPQLSVVACQVLEGWIALLEDNTGDWTSSWRTQFLDCLKQASPPARPRPTERPTPFLRLRSSVEGFGQWMVRHLIFYISIFMFSFFNF